MTAIEYSTGIENTPEEFSWRDLERHAFAPYPAIEPLINAASHALDSRKISPTFLRFYWVGILFLFPVYIGPMITAGILMAGSRADGDAIALLASAGVFAVAHIIIRVRDLIRAALRQEPAGAQETLLTVINIVFGLLTTWYAYTYSVLEAPPGAWLYFTLFLVMTVLCLASAITMIRRGRANGRGELVFKRTPASALADAVESLSAPEKESIRRDINGATEILATAGIISESDKTAALEQELGDLARWRWIIDRVAGRNR